MGNRNGRIAYHKTNTARTSGDHAQAGPADRILVSLKSQQPAPRGKDGPARLEITCLADAVAAPHPVRAFLVRGDVGWRIRHYFTSGELSEHLIHPSSAFSPPGAFIRLAHNGQF